MFEMTVCGVSHCPCQKGAQCHYSGDDAILISVSTHEKNLRKMRCVVSMHTEVTLHHCHGGSMLYIDGFDNPGMAQRANPFFQIPVHAQYHVGEYGVDTGMGHIKSVSQWEDVFGSQRSFLEEVNSLLTYDLWQQARLWEDYQ